MNFFFFARGPGIESKLQIPKFQNSGATDSNYSLFAARVQNSVWHIAQIDASEDRDFYYLEATDENSNDIFFLATIEQVGGRNITIEKLCNYNDFTETSPDYRANLSIYNEKGGFSSYQSEYPFRMTLKKGSMISPVSNLSNPNASRNFVFIRNIYLEPEITKYHAHLVSKNGGKVLRSYDIYSNQTNCIEIPNELINGDHYLIANGYLAIPIYAAQDKIGNLSFEHTHPPHENIMGKDRFERVGNLRNELLKIIC